MKIARMIVAAWARLFTATRSDVEAITHTPVTALHPS